MNSAEEKATRPDILIVDDTPANLRLLSTMMIEHGYSVRQAISGKMALIAAKTAKPDLILLDVNMPEMNGYDVCQKLKQDPKTDSVPVVFLSALDDTLDKIKAFEVGGVDYITKPFQLEEVLARIQNHLAVKQLQAQLFDQNHQLQQTLDELRQTQAQLIQQQKMDGLVQFVAGVAHEINNPISFISGNLAPANRYVQDLLELVQLYQAEYPKPTEAIQEMIQDMDLEFVVSDLNKLMDSMKTGVHRIRTIVLALRIFSRLDESDIKSVNLHEGLDSTLLLLQHRLQPQDNRSEAIEVIKDYAELPLVTCYASQMNQVFLHLLNNAIDALENGVGSRIPDSAQPAVWVKTDLTPQETIQISIRDNGIGISDEIKPQIFTPFLTTKSIGKGTGLGLSTSYQIIVQKHGGQLRFHSNLGEGAEFIIKIPVHLGNKMN
ncbi:MAG: response regulator [Microcoleaceae cyanobacterium]